MKESSKLNKNYLFFSSIEFTDTPDANLSDASVEEQAKRVFDMAKLFLEQRGFRFEDIYSTKLNLLEETFKQYFSKLINNEVQANYFWEQTEPVKVDNLNEGHEIEISCSAFL